jgi:hypothetical protein
MIPAQAAALGVRSGLPGRSGRGPIGPSLIALLPQLIVDGILSRLCRIEVIHAG